MMLPRYTILETSIGPVISESRVTVYDVMIAHDEGLNRYEIATTYNLTPLQVETALDYIAQHREILESELVQIRAEAAEREAYYRALAAEREKLIAELPMTPLRAAFYALREQNRLKQQRDDGASLSNADHS